MLFKPMRDFRLPIFIVTKLAVNRVTGDTMPRHLFQGI